MISGTQTEKLLKMDHFDLLKITELRKITGSPLLAWRQRTDMISHFESFTFVDSQLWDSLETFRPSTFARDRPL